MPETRQKLSKLAVMLASAWAFKALAGIAVDVIALIMALLSFCGISTPSLQAQGEQRRSSYFNIVRDIAAYPDLDAVISVLTKSRSPDSV
jgi:hypothetical protein